MNRRSPKRWTRPRSRAHREAHCGVARAYSTALFTHILKRLYSSEATPPKPEMASPAWAMTSLKFGWITRREFAAVPLVKTGRMLPGRPGLKDLLLKKSPLLGMIPKKKDFDGGRT